MSISSIKLINTIVQGLTWLFQTNTPPPPTFTPSPTSTPVPSFWDANSGDLIVGLLLLIAGVLIAKPLEILGKWLWTKVQSAFEAAGFGFEGRYLKALAKQHQWLKLIGVYSEYEKVQPHLKNVFISLSLISDAESAGSRFSWEKIFFGKEKNLVILGQPGTGKSTLLDYIILILTGHIDHPLRQCLGKPLPLFANLRDYGTQGKPTTLLDLMRSPHSLGLDITPPRGYFERRLSHGRCAIYLDGLDEVLDPTLHDEVVEKIKRFTSDYPNNWIVVTCRVAGWRGQLPEFRPYLVEDLDDDDIHQFIGNWYREVLCASAVRSLPPGASQEAEQEVEQRALPSAKQNAEGLWEALKKKEDLLRIVRTPLILSLVTLVHKNRSDLPEGRAKLYGECLEILLETWDKKDKDLNLPNRPSLKSKLLVLQTVALHFLRHDLLVMDITGLEALVQPLLPRIVTHAGQNVSAAEFIRQIYQRSYVLEAKAPDLYGFAHRALQDYLAALEVVERELDDLLLNHAGEERWREVILMAAWLAPEQRRDALIEALIRQGGENAAHLALAGLSLSEGAPVGERVRAEVKEHLLAGLNIAQRPSDFGLLAGALLSADPGTARDWLSSVLAGRDTSLSQRALSLLPDLKPETAISFLPLLANLIRNPHEADLLRAGAALTLAKLRLGEYQPDRTVRQALQAACQPENEIALKSAATWARCELGDYEELSLVKVEAGEFIMGSDKVKDPQAYEDELPQHHLYLPTFYIAKTPVTVVQFRAYLQSSNRQPFDAVSLKSPDDHPVSWVSWHESLAYAQWYGMMLPSEAEWEKAARGIDGRVYPWGDKWQFDCANTVELLESYPSSLQWRQLPQTPVGQFSPQGDSPYECADMAGNVREWTRSLWGKGGRELKYGYPYDPHDGREDLNASNNAPRVLRGGSFFDTRWFARCAFRYWSDPDARNSSGGFRVVVSSFQL